MMQIGSVIILEVVRGTYIWSLLRIQGLGFIVETCDGLTVVWNLCQPFAREHAYIWKGRFCPDEGGGRWEILVPCDLKVLNIVS